jgi:two-component system, OmpR family, response regulator BaeR
VASTILVVEDDRAMAVALRDGFEFDGYEVVSAGDGVTALELASERKPDLIVLDVMLPGRDGLELCKDIRAFSRVPIIMATARAEEIDRLLGLELGADDYICKPYSPREVVARVKAVLRRMQPADPAAVASDLILDAAGHRIRWHGAEVELTAVEFQLFAALYREPGRIYSRGQLMDRIYSDQRIVSDRTIDSHIKKLRKKLAELRPDEELIHSVYGAGYRYEVGREPTAR